MGWIEWVVVAQTAIPAVMVVPGTGPVRWLTRVASYILAIVAWGFVLAAGRRDPSPRPFPARPWLAGVAAVYVLSILHPATNSPIAGVADAVLNIAVMAPAFWGPAALRSSRQLPRVMVLLLAFNGASALVGIGQFYRPATFNPPVIQAVANGNEDALSYITDDGRKVLRPCGLSDTAGGATTAGTIACLVGLCWAIRPVKLLWRAAAAGLAMVGLAVIYFCQVRSSMLIAAGCVAMMAALLALRRDARSLLGLGVVGAAVSAVGTLWALRSGGWSVLGRFLTLFEDSPGQTFYRNRGHFFISAMENLAEYPLGAGLGRVGRVYDIFGDKTFDPTRGMLWAEIQWQAWCYSGGLPMIVLYTGALVAAQWHCARIALRNPDPVVSFWAAAVFSLGMSIVALSMATPVFTSTTGVQYWALLAAVHAADALSRREAAARRPAPGPAR